MPGVKGMIQRRQRRGCDRARMWASMRIMRRFTSPDICKTSGAKLDNARKYIKRLARHGFVVAVGPKATGQPGQFQAYQIIPPTTPDHPIVCPRCGKSITETKCRPLGDKTEAANG